MTRLQKITANLTAESFLTKSKISAMLDHQTNAARNLHRAREWNNCKKFGWEISFEEAKQKLRLSALDKDSHCNRNDLMEASRMLMDLCNNMKACREELNTYHREHWAKDWLLFSIFVFRRQGPILTIFNKPVLFKGRAGNKEPQK